MEPWSYAGRMGADCRLPTHKWPSFMDDFEQPWEFLFYKLNDEQLALAATIMRSIWMRRNDFVFHDKFEHPSLDLEGAQSALQDFYEAYNWDMPETIRTSRATVKWIFGRIKIIWDAAVNKHEGRMGVGVVMRDPLGRVLACLGVPKSFCSQPVVAEYWALETAMKLADEKGLENVEYFEGDA